MFYARLHPVPGAGWHFCHANAMAMAHRRNRIQSVAHVLAQLQLHLFGRLLWHHISARKSQVSIGSRQKGGSFGRAASRLSHQYGKTWRSLSNICVKWKVGNQKKYIFLQYLSKIYRLFPSTNCWSKRSDPILPMPKVYGKCSAWFGRKRNRYFNGHSCRTCW